jgi:hypothetical protein
MLGPDEYKKKWWCLYDLDFSDIFHRMFFRWSIDDFSRIYDTPFTIILPFFNLLNITLRILFSSNVQISSFSRSQRRPHWIQQTFGTGPTPNSQRHPEQTNQNINSRTNKNLEINWTVNKSRITKSPITRVIRTAIQSILEHHLHRPDKVLMGRRFKANQDLLFTREHRKLMSSKSNWYRVQAKFSLTQIKKLQKAKPDF